MIFKLNKVIAIIFLTLFNILYSQNLTKNEKILLNIEPSNQTLRETIRKGIRNINIKDQNGNTPLHIASKKNKSEDINLLIRLGARINATNIYGETPIFNAVNENNIEAVKALISKGAKLDIINNNKQSILHIATVRRNIDIINEILKNNKKVLEIEDGRGNTPLLLATILNINKVVETLITNDANINHTNNIGLYPLKASLLNNNKNNIEILISNNAQLKNEDKYLYYKYKIKNTLTTQKSFIIISILIIIIFFGVIKKILNNKFYKKEMLIFKSDESEAYLLKYKNNLSGYIYNNNIKYKATGKLLPYIGFITILNKNIKKRILYIITKRKLILISNKIKRVLYKVNYNFNIYSLIEKNVKLFESVKYVLDFTAFYMHQVLIIKHNKVLQNKINQEINKIDIDTNSTEKTIQKNMSIKLKEKIKYHTENIKNPFDNNIREIINTLITYIDYKIISIKIQNKDIISNNKINTYIYKIEDGERIDNKLTSIIKEELLDTFIQKFNLNKYFHKDITGQTEYDKSKYFYIDPIYLNIIIVNTKFEKYNIIAIEHQKLKEYIKENHYLYYIFHK